jgi:hypothetical protein
VHKRKNNTNKKTGNFMENFNNFVKEFRETRIKKLVSDHANYYIRMYFNSIFERVKEINIDNDTHLNTTIEIIKNFVKKDVERDIRIHFHEILSSNNKDNLFTSLIDSFLHNIYSVLEVNHIIDDVLSDCYCDKFVELQSAGIVDVYGNYKGLLISQAKLF